MSWTMPVSVCAICDKGRDPLTVPSESCGHDPEKHRRTVAVPVVAESLYDEAQARAVGLAAQTQAELAVAYGWCRRLGLPLMTPPRGAEAIDQLGREVERIRAQAERLAEALEEITQVNASGVPVHGQVSMYQCAADALAAYRESRA